MKSPTAQEPAQEPGQEPGQQSQPARTLVIPADDGTSPQATAAEATTCDIAEATAAVANGTDPARLLVRATPDEARRLIEDGWRVIVNVDGDGPHAAE